MNSSGIKRGLAASAIGALAVAGLPLLATSASAAPLSSAVGASAVELAVPATGTVSTANDGQNTTVRLEAVGGADVQSVRFEYQIGAAAPVVIDTVGRNDNGAFATEWAAAGLNGATVTLRAVPLAAGGVAGTADTQVVTVNATDTAVNITDGNAVGVFQQPYTETVGNVVQDNQNVIVSGTSSLRTAAPQLFYYDNDVDGAQGAQPGFVAGGTATSTTPTAPATGPGTWRGVLDISGYDYGTNDELLVGALQVTDDAEAFALYRQTITTVTAAANRTNVQAGNPATVTVTVADQNGAPIAGAEVRSSNGGEAQYTGANGTATFSQGAGAAYYYANATDSNPFEAELGDKRSDAVTITQYNAAPASVGATSANGSAFDLTEWDGDDIQVQIQDQEGQALAGVRTVEYYYVVTPFDGAPATQRIPETGTSTVITNANGRADIPQPTATDAEGTYELFVGVQANPVTGTGAVASTRVLTFKAGEATISLDGAAPTSAAAGSEATVSGKLVLDDGTGLAGRTINLSYSQTAGGGAAAAFDQPTGADLSTRTVTTGADGTFSATLDDPAVTTGAQPTERGTVTVTTGARTDANGESDNPNATAVTREVVFAQTTAPAGSTAVIGGAIATAGQQARPGEAVAGTVTIRDSSNQVIANQQVTLTVDGKSFFTDGTRTTPTPTVVGADVAGFRNLGQTITVATNAQGVATFNVTVERSEEFDDDGLAEDIVTASAGTGISDTEDVDYTSADPLNGGEVRLEFSPANEQDDANSNLPSASPGTEVQIDVYTEDQFGNLVGGELVTISDDTSDAEIIAEDASTGLLGMTGLQVRSNFDNDGDFAVTSDEDGQDQTITATWVTDTFRYSNTSGSTTTAADETLTDTITVNYESVAIDAEATTLTSSPEGNVPVGTAVTETVTVVDTEGNPVPGVTVRFTQSGPGTQTADVTRTTNAQGQAFLVVNSSQEGNALVTAIIETSGAPVTLTDTITFEDATPPQPIKPSIIGKNIPDSDSVAGYDLVTVRAAKAGADASVRLFRVKNGVAKRVKQKVIGTDGVAKFKRADLNGSKGTTYYAIVGATESNLQGRTKTITIK